MNVSRFPATAREDFAYLARRIRKCVQPGGSKSQAQKEAEFRALMSNNFNMIIDALEMVSGKPPVPEGAPGYWMYETSGVLRPAIEAYLNGAVMTDGQIRVMRAYLRQWIAAPWKGPLVDVLRTKVDDLTSREAIMAWLDMAEEASIDPL